MSTSDVANQYESEDAATAASAEALLGEAEPWESWETQLIMISIGIAIGGVIVLGFLINTFILP